MMDGKRLIDAVTKFSQILVEFSLKVILQYETACFFNHLESSNEIIWSLISLHYFRYSYVLSAEDSKSTNKRLRVCTSPSYLVIFLKVGVIFLNVECSVFLMP